MKARSILIILGLIISLSTSVDAQNPAYPYGLSFKALFMDYQSQNGGSIAEFKSYHHGFEIGFHKRLQNNINLVVPVKAGVVTSHNKELNTVHKKVFGADAQVQYLFFKPETRMTPYLIAGIGVAMEEEGSTNAQIPFGAGLYFQVKDNAYINWQSEYRYSLMEDRNNLHHGIGFVYLFGGKSEVKMKEKKDDMPMNDSDGDGLEDDIDLCPQSAGPKSLKGCPDKDEDGIPDYRDDCPSIFGLVIFDGCPDSDGDGVSDSDDECPNLKGSKDNKGCPSDDRDKDGISDAEDKCPNLYGLASMDGCPEPKEDIIDKDGDGVADDQDRCPNVAGSVTAEGCPDRDNDGVSDYEDKCPNSPGLALLNGCPDSDGDGIDDSRDQCPETKGTVAANGCPEVSKEDLQVLELAMRAVSFETGKATLKSESYPILNQIANIMLRYPNYNLLIEGHTDNVGSAINNQLLSERRAQACYEYLLRKGVSSSVMSHTGYGESRPIADNNSLTGKSLNRRVEFILKPR